MIQTTQGIVLRSIKYGETSLVTTLFTRIYGVQAYLVQGIRTVAKGRTSRAGLLQPATLLDVVVYHKPGKSLQRIRDFSPYYIYRQLQENIVRNSIALFSVELLFRLLPQDAPVPELFDFTVDYFRHLDELPVQAVANFPLFFLIQCSRYLGYELQGAYDPATPYLNLAEGGFTAEPPAISPLVADEDANALAQLIRARHFDALQQISLNAAMRTRLMEWYLQFLHRHTEHMAPMRSLEVLKAILH
jgi:DNA repair protein RecO (recombination protein O)